ncbi:C3HC zinc finger domain-containing protein [Beauveria bassiana ARSEF 2860]|uniref:C3HC zinc finger domain-containing protein n=1 Tax=Beauveria bassiana (strain ARSEF 2860) TaxID=655819 RepID=J4W3U7_BEAB2|nr:C3HC zinc finger domain-containing protein [Beauveria bassiana ARSEF 2860]EJP65095.1 C3HC zinc finger domain-containing protein [Beauveria bassiana ARSEF 2860]
MNATKRKFNALLQGLNSPRPSPPDQKPRKTADITAGTAASSSLPSSPLSTIAQKKRRMGVAPAADTASSSSLLSLASIASLRRPLQTPPPAAGPPEVAARYCPGDREQLLRRLASFQEITSWTPKPDRVGEVEWAKRGWVCHGKERVRCALCHKELVVKLNRKEQDGKEVSVLIASEIEEALVEKYADLIVSSHQPDCLWKKRGCDDSLLRISFSNSSSTLESLRQRYDELCSRQSFLPYEFNLRLPEDLVLDTVLKQLPENFFTHPPPAAAATTGQSPNRAALALALTGWQGLSNVRIGAVPNSASCHTCQRRLGLWMFKSKEVDENGKVLVPAAMDHLDPIREHRFFCPWKNPEAQSRVGATGKDAQATAWMSLLQMLKNESELRSIYQGHHRKSLAGEAPPVPEKDNVNPSTPQKAVPVLLEPMSNASAKTTAPELDEADRDAKDKERWARLRKVKSLFDAKASRKSKIPETPQSNKAATPQK